MKLTRLLKIEISKKIKKHKMEKRTLVDKDAMVAIPETEDASGKPLFISSVQFNKIWDKIKW